MALRGRWPAVACLSLGLGSTGCYTYRPIADVSPALGAEVRADFPTPISVRVGEFTIDNVNSLEGAVYETRGDSIFVWGSWVYTGRGSRYSVNGGSLLVERGQVGALQVRRLSPGKSGVAAVAAVGLVFLLFRGVEAALGGGGAGPGPPDPN